MLVAAICYLFIVFFVDDPTDELVAVVSGNWDDMLQLIAEHVGASHVDRIVESLSLILVLGDMAGQVDSVISFLAACVALQPIAVAKPFVYFGVVVIKI